MKFPLGQVLVHLYEALRLMVVNSSSAMDLVMEYLLMTIRDVHLTNLRGLAPTLQKIMVEGTVPFLVFFLPDRQVINILLGSTKYTQRFFRLTDVLLKQQEKFGGGFRGILFVQQRLTTHVLAHYIARTPALCGLHTACIYATSSEASPGFRVTPSQSKVFFLNPVIFVLF